MHHVLLPEVTKKNDTQNLQNNITKLKFRTSFSFIIIFFFATNIVNFTQHKVVESQEKEDAGKRQTLKHAAEVT